MHLLCRIGVFSLLEHIVKLKTLHLYIWLFQNCSNYSFEVTHLKEFLNYHFHRVHGKQAVTPEFLDRSCSEKFPTIGEGVFNLKVLGF